MCYTGICKYEDYFGECKKVRFKWDAACVLYDGFEIGFLSNRTRKKIYNHLNYIKLIKHAWVDKRLKDVYIKMPY